jgi:hypothetical protein
MSQRESPQDNHDSSIWRVGQQYYAERQNLHRRDADQQKRIEDMNGYWRDRQLEIAAGAGPYGQAIRDVHVGALTLESGRFNAATSGSVLPSASIVISELLDALCDAVIINEIIDPSLEAPRFPANEALHAAPQQ